MTRFHINLDGNAGRCSAKPHNCPFAADAEHFDSRREARAAYELKHATAAAPTTFAEAAKVKFRGQAFNEFYDVAQKLDRGETEFMEKASPQTVGRVMALGAHLEESNQIVADHAARAWFKAKQDGLEKLANGSDDGAYNYRLELYDVFSYADDSTMDRDKRLTSFMFRNYLNYGAVAKATLAADATQSGTLERMGLDRVTAGFSTMSPHDLAEVMKVNPRAGVVLLEKCPPDDRATYARLVYAAMADRPDSHHAAFAEEKEKAIAKALEHSRPDASGLEALHDASTKLGAVNGLPPKKFAKILKAHLKAPDSQPTPEASAELRTIVENTRLALNKR